MLSYQGCTLWIGPEPISFLMLAATPAPMLTLTFGVNGTVQINAVFPRDNARGNLASTLTLVVNRPLMK